MSSPKIISILSSDEEDEKSPLIPTKKMKINEDNDEIVIIDDEESKTCTSEQLEDKDERKNCIALTEAYNNSNESDVTLLFSDDDECIETDNSTTNCINYDNIKEDAEASVSSVSTKIQPTSLPSTSVTNNTNNNCDDNYKNLSALVLNKLEFLIAACQEIPLTTEMKKKYDNLAETTKKLFYTIKSENKPLKSLHSLLEYKCDILRNDSSKAILIFTEIFMELKALKKIKMDEKNYDLRLKKLSKALNKCNRIIKKLEEKEVDFDDEENSTYFQLSRYMKRAAEIHAAICKINKDNPFATSLVHRRLDFSKSKYMEINKALNKKFKDSLFFPDYIDVFKCVKDCVESNNLKLSENEVKVEAEHCFKELGTMVQNRRKRELMIDHSIFGVSDSDPADKSPDLKKTLQDSYITSQNRIDEICAKYTRLQETGVDPTLSEDSSNSDVEVSD